ncbi:hypothetical protein E2C01_041882 [Portunus trituberculatus]|uniref:Uncharacterized protein n=1 Tax=Portunus trituberculatus TaxID=210409 RepID=A0A5B7FRK5_PORTR|nr:hypothetical protein [Portunus trituberculatus]
MPSGWALHALNTNTNTTTTITTTTTTTSHQPPQTNLTAPFNTQASPFLVPGLSVSPALPHTAEQALKVPQGKTEWFGCPCVPGIHSVD